MMLTIKTKYFGEISVKTEDIFTFEKGIPGFLDETEFVMLPFGEDHPFYIMQSVKTPMLAFVVTEPFLFFPSYDFALDDAVVNQLQIESEQDVLVFTILTLGDSFVETTANLQAPVVLNVNKKLGKQVILSDGRYTTKHRLMPQTMEEIKDARIDTKTK